jgi:hypothetical protein
MSRCFFAIALLLGAACAHVTAERSFREKALQRAAFELGCAADQIQFTVLQRNDGFGCAGSQVGVVGCGKKAVYVCTVHQDWVNNTAATR